MLFNKYKILQIEIIYNILSYNNKEIVSSDQCFINFRKIISFCCCTRSLQLFLSLMSVTINIGFETSQVEDSVSPPNIQEDKISKVKENKK